MRSFLTMSFFLCALAAAVFPGAVRAQQASPAPEASDAAGGPPAIPSPRPVPDDAHRHKLAVQQFLAWQQGTVDRTLYTDEVNGELTDQVLDQGTRTLANMGALQTAQFLGVSRVRGTDVFVYKMACEHGSVNMDFALAPDGRISLIFFE